MSAPRGDLPLDAVTFDFWDTLLRAPSAAEMRTGRCERLLATFDELGVRTPGGPPVDAARLDEVLAEVRRTFDERWAANEQFTGVDGTALVIERLGLAVDAGQRARLVDAFIGAGDGRVPALTDHVEPALRALGDRGVRLGIICDVGLVPSSRLRGYLDHHGLLGLFDHWSFSDEVGCYKPHAPIFRHALDGLGGVAPARAAHVGDLRRTDVAGARAFGMTSVRYAGSHDDPLVVPAEGDRSMLGSSGVAPADRVEADHVITDHAQLLAVLGFD